MYYWPIYSQMYGYQNDLIEATYFYVRGCARPSVCEGRTIRVAGEGAADDLGSRSHRQAHCGTSCQKVACDMIRAYNIPTPICQITKKSISVKNTEQYQYCAYTALYLRARSSRTSYIGEWVAGTDGKYDTVGYGLSEVVHQRHF